MYCCIDAAHFFCAIILSPAYLLKSPNATASRQEIAVTNFTSKIVAATDNTKNIMVKIDFHNATHLAEEYNCLCAIWH